MLRAQPVALPLVLWCDTLASPLVPTSATPSCADSKPNPNQTLIPNKTNITIASRPTLAGALPQRTYEQTDRPESGNHSANHKPEPQTSLYSIVVASRPKTPRRPTNTQSTHESNGLPEEPQSLRDQRIKPQNKTNCHVATDTRRRPTTTNVRTNGPPGERQ